MTLPGHPLASVIDAIGNTPLVELSRLTRGVNGRILAKPDYLAHYTHTGPEFIHQSGGQIEAFCDFVGTGGSFAGCAAAFKEYNPSIRCFIVEPAGAAVLVGEAVTYPNHRIQGGGYSIPDLPLLRPEHIDGYVQVTDEEAIHIARRLAREEGIFAGFSSGANVAAALQLLQTSMAGKTVAVILCDSGLKYLSTDLWELH
ncbi:MAG: pyridoxal-phosphate dependent enzyme [Chloroflexi bacterium]|nr:pyridoxal-phosphate dependent enzyme [Chloroflexota bacterium]